MQNITLIGIDLGKHSFHIHCMARRISDFGHETKLISPQFV
ncbi:IS110 family transposase, partial [Escherichia coli]|nr:IS110 family transposase [Escherichia coli]